MTAQSLALPRAKKCLVSLTPTVIVSMPELIMGNIAVTLVSQSIKISVPILSMLLHSAYVSSNYPDKTVIVSHTQAYHNTSLQIHLPSRFDFFQPVTFQGRKNASPKGGRPTAKYAKGKA